MKTKKNIYSTITNRILKALKEGVRPWEQCYSVPAPLRNNGIQYKGINALILRVEAEVMQYESPFWITYKQAKEAGGNVKIGEKGTQIVFFKTIEKGDDKNPDNKVIIPIPRSYFVFNYDQVEGISKEVFKNNIETIPDAEDFFSCLPATVTTTQKTPAFIPSADKIRMPAFKNFKSAEKYYATLGHEYIHWTGHKSRLDRLADKSKEAYAFEELVAELGAAFILPLMGLEPLVDDQHAPYIDGYIKTLESDEKALFRAASKAQKATDYLIETVANHEKEKIAA